MAKELYEVDGTITPPYENYEKMENLSEEFMVSKLLEDFNNLSRSRRYHESTPLYISYSEIKDYIDLHQSKTLEINNYNDFEVKKFVKYIVEIDEFFVKKQRELLKQRNDKQNNR